MLGRNFIGLEREESYAKVAEKRIKNTRSLDNSSLKVSRETFRTTNTFGQLLEEECLDPENGSCPTTGVLQQK